MQCDELYLLYVTIPEATEEKQPDHDWVTVSSYCSFMKAWQTLIIITTIIIIIRTIKQ